MLVSIDFQYPQSDRALCNRLGPEVLSDVLNLFQYPQSDRALCNRRGRRRTPVV